MRTIELIYPHIFKVDEFPETVCAIGFFDGIHKGHQQVIQAAVKEAKHKNMESAVITFHPHPSAVLRNEGKEVKYITPIKEKQEILQQLNVDRLYIIKFNHELSQLSPQVFIDHFIKGLHIKHLIAGFDFTFGYKGQGNMKDMSKYAKGSFTTKTIHQVSQDYEKISSTKIRECLTSGRIEIVNQLLGRPFYIKGVVIDGDKRGRTIGFPTANLKVDPDVLYPASGVYAVQVFYKGNIHNGIANIGIKPTFKSDQLKPTIEVHILDYNHHLYGEELKISWFKFIRKERKFSSVDELIEQIKQDEKSVRHYFSVKEDI